MEALMAKKTLDMLLKEKNTIKKEVAQLKGNKEKITEFRKAKKHLRRLTKQIKVCKADDERRAKTQPKAKAPAQEAPTQETTEQETTEQETTEQETTAQETTEQETTEQEEKPE